MSDGKKVEEPPELTEEDEAILDRVWDAQAKQKPDAKPRPRIKVAGKDVEIERP